MTETFNGLPLPEYRALLLALIAWQRVLSSRYRPSDADRYRTELRHREALRGLL